ncbi:MAG TPA: neutral zinc metallopeptidase [Vicinamibacterales bacterium]|nr:neutral zinc metallopeptidase [Vicinamibacterales bacterium]
MKWTAGNRENVEDVRGSSGGGLRLGGLGLGGLLLMLVLSWATGIDFLSLVGSDGAAPPSASTGTSGELRTTPEEERMVDFVDAVMKDAQETWQSTLGGRYQMTRAVLFRDAIQSACGSAESATGPFYCPADQLVYLDLGFFNELHQRFRAPGDFAQAYVLTHEIGHHVQRLLGIETQVRRLQQARPEQQNALSVRLELQADCFAGVWGHHAAQPGRAAQGKVELEPGDVEEGLNAASAIGDDRIQRMSGSRVAPDRFTHGSSQQRLEWFRRGLESGDYKACETFQ